MTNNDVKSGAAPVLITVFLSRREDFFVLLFLQLFENPLFSAKNGSSNVLIAILRQKCQTKKDFSHTIEKVSAQN
jgi:hypothetical protein